MKIVFIVSDVYKVVIVKFFKDTLCNLQFVATSVMVDDKYFRPRELDLFIVDSKKTNLFLNLTRVADYKI